MRRVAVIVAAFACTGAMSRSAGQDVDAGKRRAEMQDHYSHLIAIHDAVVQGDVEAARAPAAELAYLSVPVGSPFGTTAFGAAIRDGARRVARETTVVGAARATTAIISACGGCHRASGAAVSPDAIVQRRRDTSASMADHVRAADDMLLGLLLPSETRWMTGAERLPSTLPLAPTSAAPGGADATLRSLTSRSRRATTAAARASNYVQLLTTCADCHRRARP